MTKAREIEAAIEDFFRREGWEIATPGDHVAVLYGYSEDGSGSDYVVNLTKLADELAEVVR
jgi:hypothetical protein